MPSAGALGNPLGGWSNVWLYYSNPYFSDWELYSHMYDNYHKLKWDTSEIGFTSNDPGLVLAPYVYVPLYIALIWFAFYYIYSLVIIWRANNRVPHGFRGTWEE